MRSRFIERTFLFTLTALSFGIFAPPAVAQRSGRPTRVLLLYHKQQDRFFRLFAQGLNRAIREELGSPVEFYEEALDGDRFASAEHAASVADYLDSKYRGLAIDVAVAVGPEALSFAIDQMHALLANVPIVCGICITPPTDPSALPRNVTGRIASALRFAPTLSMARALQPDAERVVVVGGAGPLDSAGISAMVKAAKADPHPLPLTIIRGLPLDSLLGTLRGLRPRSIVLLGPYIRDQHGQTFDMLDIVGSLSKAASAPMYAQGRDYLGQGMVGGAMVKLDDEGARTGQLVVRVLRRRVGDPMPPVEPIVFSFIVDWRQLERWGLPEKRLPPGTEVLFRAPDWWQRNRAILLVALIVIGVQSVLIGRLLLEQRRRKRSQLMLEEQQQRAEESRRQVVHMGRVALVGELAAAIGHELRQPLAAIHANAQTGARIVAGNTREFGADGRQACADIFADIVADGRQASEIITRIRALLRSDGLISTAVDLNEVCRAAARLVQHDALSRQVEVSLALDPQRPAVRGDPVQLQQVVVNLTLNAIDACATSINPQVLIATVARDQEAEVAVTDNGSGLAADVQQHLFESFFTTKAQGLGLGLVIVQSIIERHGGRVYAENNERGGATFRVVLTRARSVAVAESNLDHIGRQKTAVTVQVAAGRR